MKLLFQMWALVKRFYEENICFFAVPSYTNEETLACMNSAQASVDEDKWKNCCQRTERTILQHAAECVETLTRGSNPPLDIEVGGADDDLSDAGDPLVGSPKSSGSTLFPDPS